MTTTAAINANPACTAYVPPRLDLRRDLCRFVGPPAASAEAVERWSDTHGLRTAVRSNDMFIASPRDRFT
jgi:hypothetical protein